MLVWAALLESLPCPAWFSAASKIPYVLGIWLVMLGLSQVLPQVLRESEARQKLFDAGAASRAAARAARYGRG